MIMDEVAHSELHTCTYVRTYVHGQFRTVISYKMSFFSGRQMFEKDASLALSDARFLTEG